MTDQLRLAHHSMAGRRPYQEDAVLSETLPDGRTLLVVADGMGGHAAGEVASALAIETLLEALRDGIPLDESFRLANAKVHRKSQEPGKQGMGTTMVAVLLSGDSYQVANVGDSRGYLVTGEGIRRITSDHSFVAEAMKRGQSEEEAMTSQWKDALTRSIGIDGEVEVDVFGPFEAEKGSAVLLCSDGLYKALPDDRLRDVYGRSGGPRGAAQSLVTAAYEAGSDDNITVAIVEFGQVERERSTGTMPLEFEPPDDEDAPADTQSAATDGEEQEERGDDASAPSEGGGRKTAWWKVWKK